MTIDLLNSPIGLTLLKEFFQVFAALKYEGMSIPRTLFYDYTNFLLRITPQVEERLKLGDLPMLPQSQLQSTLIGKYPHPSPNHRGKIILVEGPITAYIPSRFRKIIKSGTIRGYADPPQSAISIVEKQLDGILKTQKKHPIFGSSDFYDWLKPLIFKALAGLHGTREKLKKMDLSCVAYQGNNYLLPFRILSEVCRFAGVPSVAYHPLTLLGTSETIFLYRCLPLVSYAYFCWGEEFKAWMTSYGVNPKFIIPTGCPRFDELPKRNPSGPSLRSRLRLNNEHIVVLADQQIPKREAVFRMTWEAIKEDPRFILVVKLHPHHEKNIALYKRWSENDERIYYVPPLELSLYDLLGEATALITYFSTAGVEAGFFKVPVLTPVFPGKVPPYLLYKDGGSIPVHSSLELQTALERLISDPEYKKHILTKQEKYLSFVTINDRNSTTRFFASLLKVAHVNI